MVVVEAVAVEEQLTLELLEQLIFMVPPLGQLLLELLQVLVQVLVEVHLQLQLHQTEVLVFLGEEAAVHLQHQVMVVTV
jgi:hypothetical protein